MNKYSEWGMSDDNIPFSFSDEYSPSSFIDDEILTSTNNIIDPILSSKINEEDIVDQEDKYIGAFAISFVCIFFLVIILNLK